MYFRRISSILSLFCGMLFVFSCGNSSTKIVLDENTLIIEPKESSEDMGNKSQSLWTNDEGVVVVLFGYGFNEPSFTNSILQKIKDEFEPKGIKVFPISAATKKGLKELLYAVRNLLDSLDPEPIMYEKEYFVDEMYDKSEPIEVYKADEHAFVIEGPRVDRMLGYTNLDDEKGFAFFQKFMKEQGIIDKLEELGIEEGDTVYLGDLEFDYYR